MDQGLKKAEKGFTLMEMVVVTGIMVFITGFLLVNTQATKGHLALDRAIHQFAQDVSRVHELSLRSQIYATCPSSGDISGYGLFVDSNVPGSYRIFAECNGNNSYQSSADGVVETITLSKGISISQVAPSSNWSIVFIPPVPDVYLTPGNPPELQITFATDQGFSKMIVINARGIVDIQ